MDKIRSAGLGPTLTVHGLPVDPDGALSIALVEALRSMVYDIMFACKGELKLRYIAVSQLVFEAYEVFLANSQHFLVLDSPWPGDGEPKLYFKGVVVKIHPVSDHKVYTVIY